MWIVELCFLNDASDIEGKKDIFLFGIQGEIIDKFLRENHIQELLQIGGQNNLKQIFGSFICFTEFDEVFAGIQKRKSVCNHMIFFDFGFCQIADIVGQAFFQGFEIVVKTLSRTIQSFANICDGDFTEGFCLHDIMQWVCKVGFLFVHELRPP